MTSIGYRSLKLNTLFNFVSPPRHSFNVETLIDFHNQRTKLFSTQGCGQA